MTEVLYWAEKGFLAGGILFVLVGVVLYGKRTHDWKGMITMFYKRIPLTVAEFKWYRLGISLLIFAVVLRIGALIFWP